MAPDPCLGRLWLHKASDWLLQHTDLGRQSVSIKRVSYLLAASASTGVGTSCSRSASDQASRGRTQESIMHACMLRG